MFNLKTYLILFLSSKILALNPDFGYKVQFKSGKLAYTSQNWQLCVSELNDALNGYRAVKDLTADCQLSCHGLGDSSLEGSEVKKLSAKLTRIEKCEKDCKFVDYFDRLAVLSLLQHCYYMNGQSQMAASAVFTYLKAAPEDKKMLSNLRFYQGLPQVDLAKVEDLDRSLNQRLLDQAMTAIDEGRFLEAVQLTEKSLDDHLKKIARCRIHCQRSQPNGQFNVTVQAALVHEIGCRQECSTSDVIVVEKSMDPLLAEHYQYLHYAYLNSGQVWQGVMAATSFLLVSPSDSRALAIFENYQRILEAKGEKFPARKEAIEFARRCQLDIKLLSLIDNLASDNLEQEEIVPGSLLPVLTVLENELDSHRSTCHRHVANMDANPEGTDHVLQEQMNDILCNHPSHSWTFNLLKDASKSELARTFPKPEPIKRRPLLDENVLRNKLLNDVITMKTGPELGGEHRVLAKGLVTKDECQQLVKLAENTLVLGNGYRGIAKPFSQLETHAGVGFVRAANMTLTGDIGPELVDILIDIGDRVKAFLERHFQLEEKLYFQFSELVCRTATVATVQGQHDDVSHPVHADNCDFKENGRCEPYTHSDKLKWRAYSTLTYLNEDFQDGEFFFAANRSLASIQAMVSPKCGRMVGFTSGPDNLHGVRGVRNGRRCAVATWFTTSSAQLEEDRVYAQVQRDKMRLDHLLKDK